jgi:hypothetical protein
LNDHAVLEDVLSMKKPSALKMKKSSMIKFMRKINYRKYLSIWNFTENHPFVKENSPFLIIIFILLIILILAIYYFYTAILSEEKVTTYFDLSEEEGNLRLMPNSNIEITYFPQEEDEVVFNFYFENLGKDKSAKFTISYDGRMKKKEGNSDSGILGVKEVEVEEEKNRTIRHYEVDFQEFEIPQLKQKFSCRLYKDKLGDIELRLEVRSSKPIFDNIVIRLQGIDFNFVSSLPEPDKELPLKIEYIYELDDESFFYGILLKGYNPGIEKEFRVYYFVFGVVIAVLSSLLATIAFEVLKEYIRKA